MKKYHIAFLQFAFSLRGCVNYWQRVLYLSVSAMRFSQRGAYQWWMGKGKGHYGPALSQKRSGMTRVVNGSQSFTCHPRVHPQMDWTIPVFAFPAETGSHVATPEGWKAELARWVSCTVHALLCVDLSVQQRGAYEPGNISQLVAGGHLRTPHVNRHNVYNTDVSCQSSRRGSAQSAHCHRYNYTRWSEKNV